MNTKRKVRTFIIAEIGINHNGDVGIAQQLIMEAYKAGCDAVKFQKRTVEKVYTKSDLDRHRESPWGITNREQKNGLEFGKKEFDKIDSFCKSLGIEWFASAWDVESQLFLRQYSLNYNKIASAMLTNKALVEAVAEEGKYTFISTGMSTLSQIEKVINIFTNNNCPFELMHCNSTYPLKTEDINLRVIKTLRKKFNVDVGYSGHETGIVECAAAVALGATSIERHITLDRAMYGSDQAASLEIPGLQKLVKYIRAVELSLGTDEKFVHESEQACLSKLRRVDTI
jgi:N-acetylneuraminate synthase